jgi:hypothetical protein
MKKIKLKKLEFKKNSIIELNDKQMGKVNGKGTEVNVLIHVPTISITRSTVCILQTTDDTKENDSF